MAELGSTLAIIPARGGSKRIPRKNLKDVAGRPLIAHAIEHATEASHVDRTIVSTDDGEIADVARQYGCDVPFLRPAELATATATTADVISHAVDWLADRGKTYSIVCLVQTTSPLRTPVDIDRALEQLAETDADSVVSVSPYFTSPHWSVESDEDGFLTEYFDAGVLWTTSPNRSQDLPELQHPNGAVFATTVSTWRSEESFYTDKTVAYEMPPERSFDIDEPWELDLVRTLLE